MNSLNVIVPGLFWHESADYEYLYKQLNVTILAKLLAKSRFIRHDLSYSDFFYHEHNDFSGSLANYYATKLELQDFATYILVEPTHLRIDRDRLLIAEPELLQLSQEESLAIIDAINKHFIGELKLYFISENLWLMGVNLDLSNMVSYPIADIIGENIDEYLPTGNSGLELHKIMNEIQMLLFNSSLNQLRESDGLLAVNSVWLWDKKISQLPFLSNSIIRSRDLRWHSDVFELQNQIQEFDTVIIDNAYYPAQYRDSFAWANNLNEIDDKLGTSLYNILKKGIVKEINLWVPCLNVTYQYQLCRRDLLKFWKNKNFEQLSREVVDSI